MIIFEYNDAVIKMIIKGRSPAMRHVVRTHRVDLDWLFERIRDDPGIKIQFIGTKFQLADILTKGQFTGDQWQHLLRLTQIVDVEPPAPVDPHPGRPKPKGPKAVENHSRALERKAKGRQDANHHNHDGNGDWPDRDDDFNDDAYLRGPDATGMDYAASSNITELEAKHNESRAQIDAIKRALRL